VILGGPQAVRRAAHDFVSAQGESVGSRLAASQRLTRLGNNGRVEAWRVAWEDGFLRHPILGTGAGTYATLWTRDGTSYRRVLNAHSLYLEELAELGIVGGGLLVAAIVAMLVALARRARGPDREAWAALLATGVMWAVHAGVDWDWQMPAVSAWFFAAGALALAAPADQPRRALRPPVRWAIALGCLVLTITPAVVWRSQTKLIQAVAAFERGDCPDAESDALASNSALRSRPDPFELISYCEAAAGQFPLALSAIKAAEQRDPKDWELRYSDSLISAVAGRNPRPAARVALELYPKSPLTIAAEQAFTRGGPRAWRRFAVGAPLPVPRPQHQ
jgi:O-Antigen ligase